MVNSVYKICCCCFFFFFFFFAFFFYTALYLIKIIIIIAVTFNNGTCGGTDIVVPNFVNLRFCHLNTIDSRYLEVEWTLRNTSRYPYFDIPDL